LWPIGWTAQLLLVSCLMQGKRAVGCLVLGLVACSSARGGDGGVGTGGAAPGTGAAAGGGADGVGGGEASIQPPDWDAGIRVRRAPDESDDPHVFETHLVARVAEVEILPGIRSEVYTYDGGIPGPEIR